MQHNGMEKGRRKRFHGEAKHGGAMTDSGETRKTLYLGSKGVIAASTRCQGVRRSYVRLIAGSGGAPAVNFAGGATAAFGGESSRGALNWREGGGDGMACGCSDSFEGRA